MRMRAALAPACITLACIAFVQACGKKGPSDEGTGEGEVATPVEVAAAKTETIHRTVTAEAVVFAVLQADVVPKITAPVERFLVQRGDHVRAGQLLAVLEHKDLAAAAQEGKQTYAEAQATYETTTAATAPEDVEKAEGDAAAARTALDAARRVFDSRTTLFQQGAIPKKLVDDAQVALVQAQSQSDLAQRHLADLQRVGHAQQLKGARAQLDAAKAHYESAAAQNSYSDIRTPIAGVVADRAVNVGGVAASGAPLMSVVDLSEVTAHVNLPVGDALNIRVGQKATVKAGDISIPATVTVVSPVVDPNTTTLQIWVRAKNPGERLKPGLTASVSIEAGEVPNAVVVPNTALLSSDEGGDKVMIAGSDNLAHERPVKVGAREGDEVQIVEGVKPGDQVIVSGGLGLDDKAKITVGKGDKAGAEGDKAGAEGVKE